MALVNHAKREINAKIVFFGPGRSGKATNLNYIYRKLKPEHRGKLKAMNLEKDRMLFFDFAPSGQGKVGAYNVRFHIYSITGDTAGSSSWKMVLKGVDGVVFVADSAPARLEANLQSLVELQKALNGYGIKLAQLPGVLQCNKRDLPSSVPLDELRSALAPCPYPVIPASACRGEGVLESLYNLMKSVLKDLREKGLELDKEPEQLDAPSVLTGEGDGPRGMGPSADAAAAAPAVAAGGDLTAPVILSGNGDTPASIGIAGPPDILPDGRLRLPLSLRCGDTETKIALTVTVSLA